ncbi:MAG: fibronectin type III domain-containing protein, partial [Clostridia bacterium]|nr:fibronectin type III domain-containing protein [Clostridia bacterium]
YAISEFGVRTLELIATGRKESANMYNRTAVFNGKTVFLKGADWCTIDAMMNFTREDYDRILSRAYDQGLNVFRSWGGGMCETEDFYDLCDEYGLCVYQEWPCCWDSQQKQPADVLYETVILNTKRIRNRPSLLVYGGGNEGEAPTSDKVMNNIGKLTYQYDGTRDFWRQDGGVGANGIRHDHIHWGGEDPEHYASVYYDANFNLHEYGLDAMMNIESIAKFATAKEMAQWPVDPKGTVAYHTATFNGMKGWTQTPYGYDIDTFIHYASQFVEVDSLESLITGSQIAQTMADVPAAFNSRINFPAQSMVMFYKFNDVYPGASWSVVDYYGAPKMAYWFLQDAYAPLTAGVKADRYDTYNKTDHSLSLPVYVLDDADELKNSEWEVTVKAYNSSLKTVRQENYKGSGSIEMKKKLGQFTLTEKETDTAPLFIVTTLYKNGSLAARTYMFMNAGKDPGCLFAIPAAEVRYTVSGNTVRFVNNSDIPAAAVRFDVGGASDTFRPSDNWFWLEPGESYEVTVNDASVIKGINGFNMIDVSDKKAPAAPKNVKVKSESYDTLTVSWDKPKNNGEVRFYEIYLDGTLLTTVKGTASSFKIEGLRELTSYRVEVLAVDGGMNRSPMSKKVTAETVADNVSACVRKLVLTGPNSATVTFSRQVNPASASNTDAYLLNLGGRVVKAEPSADGFSVDLTFEGVDGVFTGRTLTVVGVRDTSRSANPSARSFFRLDGIAVGKWSFDTESDVLFDESAHHAVPGSAAGASYETGPSGPAVRPVKNSIILTQTDVTLENTVISF